MVSSFTGEGITDRNNSHPNDRGPSASLETAPVIVAVLLSPMVPSVVNVRPVPTSAVRSNDLRVRNENGLRLASDICV